MSRSIFLKKNIFISDFACTCCFIIKKTKGSSSKEWIKRQVNDIFVKRAGEENWRCRSAYKLIEMDDRYKLFKPGDSVVDCGASPGSWTQVAVQRVNADHSDKKKPKGSVIGIDLKKMESVSGAVLIPNSDFTSKQTRDIIIKHLKGEKVNVVLSDMAPNSSGFRHLDHEIIVKLCLSVMKFSVQTLSHGGHMVCKLWSGKETDTVTETAHKFFGTVKTVKPEASRSDSAEIYILCKDFQLKNE